MTANAAAAATLPIATPARTTALLSNAIVPTQAPVRTAAGPISAAVAQRIRVTGTGA